MRFVPGGKQKIENFLKDTRVEAIFRYVDDFLILSPFEVDEQRNRCRNTVLGCFQKVELTWFSCMNNLQKKI